MRWSDLSDDQRAWVRKYISNGCGPQQGRADDICKRLMAVAALSDGDIKRRRGWVLPALAALGHRPGLAALLKARDAARDGWSLLPRLCELGEASCDEHDFRYWVGGERPGKARRKADRRMLLEFVKAIVASDLDDEDRRRGVLIAALGWLAVRLGGRDDFADVALSMDDMVAQGMPA